MNGIGFNDLARSCPSQTKENIIFYIILERPLLFDTCRLRKGGTLSCQNLENTSTDEGKASLNPMFGRISLSSLGRRLNSCARSVKSLRDLNSN
jgi:hypothetical protein